MNSLNDSIHQDWKVREARRASAEARYHVTVWHGPNGSIAEVRDRVDPDACLWIGSSITHGSMFYILALEHAKLLNVAR